MHDRRLPPPLCVGGEHGGGEGGVRAEAAGHEGRTGLVRNIGDQSPSTGGGGGVELKSEVLQEYNDIKCFFIKLTKK